MLRFIFTGIFLFCTIGLALQSQCFANHDSNIPPGLDAGAILSQDRWNRMNPFFLRGPVSIDDLKPKDPVIIDEYGILPRKMHQEVHGLILPEDPTEIKPLSE